MKKTKILIMAGTLAVALSQSLISMASDVNIVTMEKVQAIELMLISALDLKIVPSNETNFPTFDKLESLEVASIEEFGGALQFESNLFTATDYSEPIETMLTLDAVFGEIDTNLDWYESAIPFRWHR